MSIKHALDADLFAETQSVKDETGMTPRQLADQLAYWKGCYNDYVKLAEIALAERDAQRAELLAALEGVVAALEGRVHSNPALLSLAKARAAIAKVKS